MHRDQFCNIYGKKNCNGTCLLYKKIYILPHNYSCLHCFCPQLDNHGNHMLLTDESPINVPGIAAAHVIKRYTAQAVDEISLEVL